MTTSVASTAAAVSLLFCQLIFATSYPGVVSW